MMEHPTYPRWVLDDSIIPDPLGEGQRVVDFAKVMRHPKSTLPDRSAAFPRFWERIARRIYGPRDADGERIVRQVFIMIPRGARKSSFAGILGLYHTAAKGVRRPGGQVLLAAGSKDQAGIVFEEAQNIALETPGVVKLAKGQTGPLITRGSKKQIDNAYIQHEADKTIMTVQSADGDLSHGTTPNVVIYDELHVFRRRTLWDALQSGLVKLPNPLSIVITTAGRGQENLAYSEYQNARKIALRQAEDPGYMPHYLPILFEPPSQDADWEDRNLWELCNPGMAEGFPDPKGFAIEAESVKGRPLELERFKQYNLNFWSQQSTSPFVDMGTYDLGAVPVDLEAHKAFQDKCWMAIDLGVNNDLSCIALAWPDPELPSGYEVAVWFFCPEEHIDKKGELDGVSYVQWAKDEFITPTAGNITDYTVVQEKIEELCAEFNVQEIAFDKARAGQMMSNLGNEGRPVVDMPQGWRTMMPAIDELERSILAKRFAHGGHPVLRWNFDNVEVYEGGGGNRTFHKGLSRGRIDGAQAVAMAVGRAHANGAPEATPVPFYMQEGFNVDDALGLADGADAAAADEDAAMDARIRAMLEDD